MIREDRQDTVMDPTLAAAMAELRAEPLPEVDWDRLRRSINERAELPLARRRGGRARWLPRPLVPIAVAASIAFGLYLGPGVMEEMRVQDPSAQIAIDFDEERILSEALGGDLTEQEFRLLVTGRSNPEHLLAFAISD